MYRILLPTFLCACLFAVARADDDGYARWLVAQGRLALSQAQISAIVLAGEVKTGETSTPFEVRAWRKGADRFRVESRDARGRVELLVVADGEHVWRWNPNRQEYTVVEQPDSYNSALARIKSLASGTSATAVDLISGTAELLPVATYELSGSADYGDQGTWHSIRVAQGPGTEYVCSVLAPKSGTPLLQGLTFTQTRRIGNAQIVTTWRATFPGVQTLEDAYFRFQPPAGARGVSGFEGGQSR